MTMNPTFSNDDLSPTPTSLDKLLQRDLQNRIRELSGSLPVDLPVDLANQSVNSADLPDRDSSLAQSPFSTHLSNHIAYSEFEICKTLLIKHEGQQVVVICVAEGDAIPHHQSLRGTAISVLSGEGTLDLDGEEIQLEPEVFAYIPPKTFHSIRAIANLALLCVWA